MLSGGIFFAFLFLYLVQKGSPLSEIKLQEETANREDLFCVCEFRLNHNEHILPSLFCVCVWSFVLLVVKVKRIERDQWEHC